MRLPEGWKEVEFQEISDFTAGFAFSSSEYKTDGIKIIRIQNLGNNKDEKFVYWYGKYEEKYLIKKGDLLLSLSGTIPVSFKIYTWKDEPALLNQRILKINLNENVANKKYISYAVFNGLINIYSKATSTTGIANVSLGVVKSLKIPLPPLPTQQKIVSILEKVGLAKDMREEVDELTKDFLKAVFIEMFGDPIRNNKKFPIARLKDLALIERNSVSSDKIKKGDKYVGLEHLESESGRIIKVISVSEGNLKSNKFSFDENCVLYGKLRPYLNKIALPDFKGICSTDIIPIRPIKEKSNKYFIAYILKQQYYIKLATDRSAGANLPRLSPRELELFEIICPPIELQNKFASIVKEVESIKEQQKHSKENLDNLFKVLMQKAFKGELAI